MKTVFFNENSVSIEKKVNDWIDKHINAKIEDIKLSSCCTSGGYVYTQVMIIYSEDDNSIKL